MGLFDFLFRKDRPAPPQSALTSEPQKVLNWRASEPHLFLLSRFRHPQNPKNVATPQWEGVLGESPHAAVDRFVKDGALVAGSLSEKLGASFRAIDLKPLLKERGLPMSGSKDVLIERLILADPEGMASRVGHLVVLTCSPEASLIAEKYLSDKQNQRDAAIAESFALVREKKFASASRCVSKYEASQVFSRGVGIDWASNDPSHDVKILEMIFSSRPDILDGLAESEWEPLRVAAAMTSLWGVNSVDNWLPVGFVGVQRFDLDTAARMLLFHAHHKLEMISFREMGVKKAVINGSGDDSCEHCRSFGGKTLLLAKIPELPHAGCTHDMGCRCFVSAVFDD